MDKMRLFAQVVIALGLVFVWPGPELARYVPWPSTAVPVEIVTVSVGGPAQPENPSSGAAWFDLVRASCNPVEVEVRLARDPAPASFDGQSYQAACLALSGKIDLAREVVLGLPEDQRWQAMTTVFEVGHPVADAGDDLAAGPLMELVVEFWPNHYMALYHAGAARFALGDHGPAKDYLQRFLTHYPPEDGWRSSAVRMLAEIG